MAGIVYLLHFDRPFAHARHYMGWTGSRLEDRLDRHRRGDGANLLRHVTAAGIGWTLSRTWDGERHRERQLKRQGGHSRKCPICKTGTRAVADDLDRLVPLDRLTSDHLARTPDDGGRP